MLNIKALLKFIDKSKTIIFVYYFNETKKQITQLIETMQLEFSSDIHVQKKITITLAENLLDAKIDSYKFCILFYRASSIFCY
jgi:hypothetical protein